MEFSEFSTGSGKKLVNISKDSFERAYECLDVSEHSSSSTFNNISNDPPGISGFSTGSGRGINPVSKESMEKAYKCLDVPTNLSSPSTNSNNNPSGIFGFSTGSGREINPLSKESIEKAYKFLDIPTDLSSPSTNFNNISNNPSGISGFSTGSGKGINPVSKESMEKAYKCLDVPTHSLLPSINSNNMSNNTLGISGFSAGSGKGINPVSKESMEKAYKCLDVPTDLSSPSTNSNNISNNPSGIPGFSTGSGREINPVSKESMEKAYKCLDVPTHSLLPSINSNNISNNILGISGFSTGSGRGINPISKESMEEAYKHLDVSEQSSSNIRPLKDNDIKNNIKKSKKNRHSIKYDSNIYKSPSIKSSHQSNLKSRTPLKSLHSLQNIKNSSPQSNKNNDNNKKKYKKNIKSSSLSSQTTISSSINNNDDDDNNIGTKFFELSSSVPRNVMGNLVYHHPLKFTEQNLLNFEIPTDALYINPSNATHYRFTWPRLFSKSDSQPQQKTWGPNEALSCLIECGANPKLIDEQWVLNHYKWIVWKITSMIRSYPYLFRDWLSSDTVLDQLRYRYEREINRAHRSSIKLIVEGDTSPSWPIVLCVSDIIDDKIPIDSKLSLELTDGWYKIHACIDPPLQRAIMKSKIKIGSKLEICGAKVYGESVGKTSVLEATNSIYLKLSGNSTKPAHWDSKLGFGKFRPFASLNSLTPDGGFIFAIDVVVMRKYPLMYRETTKDGIYIMRNEKGEELAQRKFTEQMQEKVLSLLEIYHKVGIGGDDSANNNIRQKQAITKQYVNSLTSGEEIFNLLHENTEDSNRIFEYLSSDQIRWLNDWLNRKKIRDLNEKNDWLNEQLESMDLKCVRSVVPFFKVRVCDYHETVGEVQSRVKREALITIWSPSSSLYDSIREGQRNHIYSLMVANNQSYDPNLSTTIPLIRLTSIGHTTIWREQQANLNKIRNSLYNIRVVTSCDELEMTIRTNRHHYQKEHDMVVIVLVVGEIVEKIQYGITIEIQTAIATDTSGQLVFIEFNKSFFINLNNLLIPKSILTIINLKHTGYDSNHQVHILSTCDETEVRQFPHEDYLKQAKSRLESWVKVNESILNVFESNAQNLYKSFSSCSSIYYN
ncbi:3118_t:CDS:2 [Entrophospora sp. SA101]|nr:3118_t:CDS:2 [Entrophospora sp. SA101]